VKARGIFITTLLSINAFLGGFAYGFNSRQVLVIDPSLPPVVPAKVAEPAKAIVPVKAVPAKAAPAKGALTKGASNKGTSNKGTSAKSSATNKGANTSATAKSSKSAKTGTQARTKSINGSGTKGNK